MVIRIAQSVQQLAMGWKIRGSNPGGGEIFRTRSYRLWGPHRLPYSGHRVSFPGGKGNSAGCDGDYPTHFRAKAVYEWSYAPASPLACILCNMTAVSYDRYNVYMKNEITILINNFIPLFLSALHVSNEFIRSSSAALHNILYHTVW